MRRGRTRNGNNRTANRNYTLIMVIAAIIIIAISTTILIIKNNKHKKDLQISEQQRQEEISKIFEDEKIEENKEDINEVSNRIKPSKVKIKIVPNIQCENAVLNSAYNRETNEFDFSYIFTDIKDLVSDADITIGNLETNFAKTNYSNHNSPEKLIDSIKDLNIKVLNIANNQNLSDGVDGLISTKNALTDAEIETYGTSIDENDSNLLIKEVKGIKIAFLSYIISIDDNIKVTEENEKYINLYSDDKVEQEIKYVKEQGAEYICVNIHTGNTRHKLNAEQQDEINNKLIEYGADLIIGTHSNTIGKLEVKQNSEGKNIFIADSMGNLISEYSNLGLVLEVEIIRSEQEGGTVLNKVVYYPVYTIDNGAKSKERYKVINIRETIKKYENEDSSIVSKKIYNDLKQSLDKTEKLIKE